LIKILAPVSGKTKPAGDAGCGRAFLPLPRSTVPEISQRPPWTSPSMAAAR